MDEIHKWSYEWNGLYYDIPCMCKNWCELFTCKEIIDFIRYGEFWFCEFHFLRYFYVVGNAAEFELEKAHEHVHYCIFPRCHRTASLKWTHLFYPNQALWGKNFVKLYHALEWNTHLVVIYLLRSYDFDHIAENIRNTDWSQQMGREIWLSSLQWLYAALPNSRKSLSIAFALSLSFYPEKSKPLRGKITTNTIC